METNQSQKAQRGISINNYVSNVSSRLKDQWFLRAVGFTNPHVLPLQRTYVIYTVIKKTATISFKTTD